MRFIFIIFMQLSFAQLPSYISNIARQYKIDIKIVEGWSYAESSHYKYGHTGDALGRFGIRPCWFYDYLHYIGCDSNSIRDYKKLLTDDRNNTEIACWSFAFWRRRGFTDREIMQIWLFGLHGVYEFGHWSDLYERRIFGDVQKVKLNYKAYERIK